MPGRHRKPTAPSRTAQRAATGSFAALVATGAFVPGAAQADQLPFTEAQTIELPRVEVAPPAEPVELPAFTVEVQPGDYLFAIAQRNGLTSWEPLYEENREIIGDDPDHIEVGQVLTSTPAGRHRAPAPVPPPTEPTPEVQDNDVVVQESLPPVPPAAAPAPEPAPFAGVGAARAVEIALAQIGDPYVWAATGPNSFDCSGLVQFAFGGAGIALPRVSSAQAQAGVPVSRANLQPGDLVAFYSPVSHIGIYIGNGQIVHAPTSGDVVKVVDLDSMPTPTAMRRVA